MKEKEKEPTLVEILAAMDMYAGVGLPGSGYIFLKKTNGEVIHNWFYIDDKNVVRKHITGEIINLAKMSDL